MWSPFSFDSLDVDSLPNVSTDMEFDEGIVKAEDKADDDGDLDLFQSYQLTKEGADLGDFGDDDDEDTDDVKEDNMSMDDEDLDESVLFAECDKLFEDIEEGSDTENKSSSKDDGEDQPEGDTPMESGSIFEEMDDLFKECGNDCTTNKKDDVEEGMDDLDNSEEGDDLEESWFKTPEVGEDVTTESFYKTPEIGDDESGSSALMEMENIMGGCTSCKEEDHGGSS